MPSVPNTASLCKTPKCAKLKAMNLKTGLCMSCHSVAKRLVESGTTTWKRLAELGLVTSAQEFSDPFTQAFNEASKE